MTAFRFGNVLGSAGSVVPIFRDQITRGRPVRIADLARQVIELSGKIPDVDVTIEFTGLKPGKKLAKVLSDEGEEVRPCVNGIMEIGMVDTTCRLRSTKIDQLVKLSRSRPDGVARCVFELLESICAVFPSRDSVSVNNTHRPAVLSKADRAC